MEPTTETTESEAKKMEADRKKKADRGEEVKDEQPPAKKRKPAVRTRTPNAGEKESEKTEKVEKPEPKPKRARKPKKQDQSEGQVAEDGNAKEDPEVPKALQVRFRFHVQSYFRLAHHCNQPIRLVNPKLFWSDLIPRQASSSRNAGKSVPGRVGMRDVFWKHITEAKSRLAAEHPTATKTAVLEMARAEC